MKGHNHHHGIEWRKGICDAHINHAHIIKIQVSYTFYCHVKVDLFENDTGKKILDSKDFCRKYCPPTS